MSALLPSLTRQSVNASAGSTLFEQHQTCLAGRQVRRLYDDATETRWFLVVDIGHALIQQPDQRTSRKYWNKLKQRLGEEGSQSVTNRHQLK